MFIDIHAHAYKRPWPGPDGKNAFPSPAQLLKRYDELDIEQGIVLPILGPELYLPQSNEEVLEIKKDSGGRLEAFCNIDPRAIYNSPAGKLDYILEYYKNLGCLGLGEVMPYMHFNDPLLHNLFCSAEKVGLPVIIDATCGRGAGCYGLYDEPGLPGLEECLQIFPALTIIGHGPGFWAELGQIQSPKDRCSYPSYPVREEGSVPRLMRRYPNLYAEFSAGSGCNALARDLKYASRFIEEFQDRLFFGTDICKPDQSVMQAQLLINLVEDGEISRAAFKKVARENAVKLFQL
jgi:predicted TIM-barrel fold metal-dependent hydrolase